MEVNNRPWLCQIHPLSNNRWLASAGTFLYLRHLSRHGIQSGYGIICLLHLFRTVRFISLQVYPKGSTLYAGAGTITQDITLFLGTVDDLYTVYYPLEITEPGMIDIRIKISGSKPTIDLDRVIRESEEITIWQRRSPDLKKHY